MFGHDPRLTVCLHVDIDGSWTIDSLAELISDNTILHGTLLACHAVTCTATRERCIQRLERVIDAHVEKAIVLGGDDWEAFVRNPHEFASRRRECAVIRRVSGAALALRQLRAIADSSALLQRMNLSLDSMKPLWETVFASWHERYSAHCFRVYAAIFRREIRDELRWPEEQLCAYLCRAGLSRIDAQHWLYQSDDAFVFDDGG